MEFVSTSVDAAGIAVLTMDSGDNRNTLSEKFVRQLLAALDALQQQSPKVILLCGRSDVFCAGADREGLEKLSCGELSTADLIVADRVLALPCPVIAVMAGHAIGGGLAMAACCDIVLAANESRYGAVFMNMGFTPGMGTTRLLALMFGEFIAAEMLYSGKRYRGKELAARGCLINHIGAKDALRGYADNLAARIAEKPLKSLYLLKHSLSGVKKELMLQARQQEDLMHQISFSLPETKKRVAEFY